MKTLAASSRTFSRLMITAVLAASLGACGGGGTSGSSADLESAALPDTTENSQPESESPGLRGKQIPQRELVLAAAGVAPTVPAIAAGAAHSLALNGDGAVFGWGSGFLDPYGSDLGLYPAPLPGPEGAGTLAGVIAIATGSFHSLALNGDGTVWAWGDGMNGELGNNSNASSLFPLRVVGSAGAGDLTGVTAVATGSDHSLALKGDGTVWAWGYGGSGQLGNNSVVSSPFPVQVTGPAGIGKLSGVSAIAAGWFHSLALKGDGTVWAWGLGFDGELGNNSTAHSSVPVQAMGQAGTGGLLTGVSAIAAGGIHSLALKGDGTVWAWGYGGSGQLGNNSTASSLVPVQVVGPAGTGPLTGVTAIAASPSYSLALKGDGTVWTWGYGGNGQLGNGSTASSLVPVQVVGPAGTGALTGVTSIAAGSDHSLALKGDGTVWAWGYGGSGQLGNNSAASSLVPVQVVGPLGQGFLTLVVGDTTPPVVTYSGNAGHYTVDQVVNIVCSAADNESGIASTTCVNIAGPAYSFAIGNNTFSATAIDVAGNPGSALTSFTVAVTTASMVNLTNRFVTHRFVEFWLDAKLKLASAAGNRGNLRAKAILIAAYVADIRHLSGKAISAIDAEILIRLAAAL